MTEREVFVLHIRPLWKRLLIAPRVYRHYRALGLCRRTSWNFTRMMIALKGHAR